MIWYRERPNTLCSVIINLLNFSKMKKKLLLAGAVALMAAAAVTGYSVYNKTNVSDLLNSNVEALAFDETTPGQRYECYDKYKLYTSSETLTNVRTCDICDYQQVYKPRTKSVCPR